MILLSDLHFSRSHDWGSNVRPFQNEPLSCSAVWFNKPSSIIIPKRKSCVNENLNYCSWKPLCNCSSPCIAIMLSWQPWVPLNYMYEKISIQKISLCFRTKQRIYKSQNTFKLNYSPYGNEKNIATNLKMVNWLILYLFTVSCYT